MPDKDSAIRGLLLVIVLTFAPAPGGMTATAADLTSPAEGAGHKARLPGDDFYAYVNGDWVEQAEIPAGKGNWGPAAALAGDTALRTIELLDATANDPAATGSARMVRDFYVAFMDDTAIEAKGLAPLKPVLHEVDAIHGKTALAQALGRMLRTDAEFYNISNFDSESLFGLWVAQGFDDPTRNVAYLLQGGLGLPDRDNYLSTDARMADLRAKYRQHVAAMFRLAGYAAADKRAAHVFDLEMKIAQAHATREDSDDELKGNNPWNIHDFAKKAPGLDWNAYFKGAGLGGEQTIVVWHPGAIVGSARLVAEVDLESWKDFLRFHLINHYANVLPKAFVAQHAAFYDRDLAGMAAMPTRAQRGLDQSNLAMRDLVGRLYAERYFPATEKARVQAMVANIKAAFARHLDQIDWMAPATKAEAQAKLKALYIGVGYPDQWPSYEGLQISSTDAFGNVVRAERFHTAQQLAKLGQPAERSEWQVSPHMTVAINMGMQNALNFPAAYLQPPYYNPAASDATNYGSIGAIVGHEISHMFDETGARYDATSRQRNWWSAAEQERYKQSMARLVTQYSAYEPVPGLHINGQQTLTENTADVVGLTVALRACQGARSPGTDAVAADREFFIGFAQARRNKMTEAALRAWIAGDPHAPAKYRIETVRNLDAWYQAFDVQPGQALYLAPGDRVEVR